MIERIAAGLALWALLSLPPTAAAAKDLSGLYPRATLEHWQPRFAESIRWNFENVILPALTPEERGRLGRVRLDFPLVGAGGDPLDFHSTTRPPVVTMPTLSVKFLDDLAIAIAWLNVSGNRPEALQEYVAMLKYRQARELPGGVFPEPLPALGVPEDALQDPYVDDVSKKITKSAVVWILLHEIGHIVYDHPGYGAGVRRRDAQRNEAEADAFATEVMRRIGEAPGGMTVFFLIANAWWSNRGDFSSDAAWRAYLESEATHPMTGGRMRAIGEGIVAAAPDFARNEPDPRQGAARVRGIGEEIIRLAGFYEDTDLQRLTAGTARQTEPATLKPRRRDAPPPAPLGRQGALAGAAAPASFHGEFHGAIAWQGQPGALPLVMQLERRGDRVDGVFSFGAGVGTITGVVEQAELFLTWELLGDRGRGRIAVHDGGERIEGTWGPGEAESGGGSWRALRQP